MYKIYLHRDINNQIFYVGCTKNIRRPYLKFSNKLTNRSIEWFERCNNQFTVEIYKDNLTEEQAYQMEIELIAKYGRQCDGGILVNKSIGGNSANGMRHSNVSKEKISSKNTGFKNGRAKQVICTLTGKIWGCAKDCAIENNININTLRGQLNGHLKNNTSFEYNNPD